MSKTQWKPGNMLYPVPAALISVSCMEGEEGRDNLFTVAWTGTVCSDPPMVSIAVRKERFSHHMIEETGEFVINLTTKKLARVTDYCGVKSGRDEDKWKTCKLTKLPGEKVSVPLVKESPVNLECKVTQTLELGSHTLFLAEVVSVWVDEKYLDEKGRFHLRDADPIAYLHGGYYTLAEKAIGTFGYSVKKTTGKKIDTKKNGRKRRQGV